MSEYTLMKIALFLIIGGSMVAGFIAGKHRAEWLADYHVKELINEKD